jgi:very-short-patch-repair endonuclease
MNRQDKAAGNLTNAQRLRREQSPAEGVLWGFLRAHRLGNFKFRRQVAMGPWVADFYCAEASLVIELDGASHRGERKATDVRKDAWMLERSTVLRICRERCGQGSAGGAEE